MNGGPAAMGGRQNMGRPPFRGGPAAMNGGPAAMGVRQNMGRPPFRSEGSVVEGSGVEGTGVVGSEFPIQEDPPNITGGSSMFGGKENWCPAFCVARVRRDETGRWCEGYCDKKQAGG